MTVLYTNNAATTLAASISNTATSFSVPAGLGALFPQPIAGQHFFLTLIDSGGNLEIVKVTERDSDTMTVVERAQEGTTALAFAAGAKVELRITKGMLDQLKLDAVALGLLGYTTPYDLNSSTGAATALGLQAVAGTRAVGIGYHAIASADRSVAVGFSSNAGMDSVAIGSIATSNNGVSIGANITNSDGIAIGRNIDNFADAIVLNAGVNPVQQGINTSGFFVMPVRASNQSQTNSGTLQYDAVTGEIFYAPPAAVTTLDGGIAVGMSATAPYGSFSISIGNSVGSGESISVGYNNTTKYKSLLLGSSIDVSQVPENQPVTVLSSGWGGGPGPTTGGFFATDLRDDLQSQDTGNRRSIYFSAATREIYYSDAPAPEIYDRYGIVRLGQLTVAETGAVAVGAQAQANANGSIAIGNNATTTNQMGLNNVGLQTYSIAVGFSAQAGKNSVILGGWTQAQDFENVTAIGNNIITSSSGVLALNAKNDAFQIATPGFYVQPIRGTTGVDRSVFNGAAAYTLKYVPNYGEIYYDEDGGGAFIGYTDNTAYSVAVGGLASSDTGGTAIGYNSLASPNGTALGYNARLTGPGSVTVGQGSFVGSPDSVAIGTGATIAVPAYQSVALGVSAVVNAEMSNAIGYGAVANAINATVISAAGPLAAETSGFYVKPIRDNTYSQTASGTLQYDSATGEIFYGAASGGGGLTGFTNDNTGLGVNAVVDPGIMSAIAIGQLAGVTGTAGNNSIAMGTSATVTNAVSAIAIGYGALTSAENAVALGKSANAACFDGIAIGNLAVAQPGITGKSGGIAIGKSASADDNSIVIGQHSWAGYGDAIVLNATGTEASPFTTFYSGFYVKPIRSNTYSQTSSGTLQYDSTTGEIFYAAGGGLTGETLDYDSNANTGASVRLGFGTTANTAGVAVGWNAAAAANGTALGSEAVASNILATAIGAHAVAEYMSATALGGWAEAKAEFAIAVGGMVKPGANYGVAIGGVVFDNALNGIAIGSGSSAVAGDSIAIGSGSVVNLANGISLGSGSSISGTNGISIGQGNQVIGDYGIVIGTYNQVAANGIVLNATSGSMLPNGSGFYVKPIRDNSIGQTSSGALQYDSNTGEIFYAAGGLTGTTTDFDFGTATGGFTTLGQFASFGSAVRFSTAIGFNAQTNGDFTTAVGAGSRAYGESSTAVGHACRADGLRNTAVGRLINATVDNVVALGFDIQANTTGSQDIIAINGTANTLNITTSGFFVKPVRASGNSQTSAGGLSYDSTTGEIYSDDNLTAERGTFTPTLKGTTAGTNISGTGYYRRVGKQVTVHMDFQNVNTTGHTGNVRISGLPFTIAGYYSQTGHAKVYTWGTLASNKLMAHFDSGATYADIYTQDTTGNWTALAMSAGTGRYVVVDGTFMIA